SPGAPAAFPAPLAVRAARDDPAHRDARRLLSSGRTSRLTRALPAVLRAARRRGPSGRVEAPPSLLEHLLVARSRGVAHAGRVPTPATGDSVRAAVGRAPARPPPRARHRRRRRPRLGPASRPPRVALVAGRRGRRSGGSRFRAVGLSPPMTCPTGPTYPK